MEVALRELQSGDLSAVIPWIDPALFRVFREPVDEKQLELMLSRYDEQGMPQSLGYKGVDAGTGQMVGVVHAVVNTANNYAHIGQVVVGDPQLRGHGIGRQMLKQLLDICFGTHHLHRVQLFTHEDNAIALACYQRVGFTIEGLMRESTRCGNEYISEYGLSILEHEWKCKRQQETKETLQ